MADGYAAVASHSAISQCSQHSSNSIPQSSTFLLLFIFFAVYPWKYEPQSMRVGMVTTMNATTYALYLCACRIYLRMKKCARVKKKPVSSVLLSLSLGFLYFSIDNKYLHW